MVDRYCVGMQAYSALDYSAYKENKLVNQPTHRYTRRRLHMCCGYPGHLDDEDYPKADVDSYFKLARELDDCGVDQVSLEHAHRANDLSLLEFFQKSSVILGAIDVARSRIESVDEVRILLKRALMHIDADRLIAAPDCGLILLDRDTAMAKLRNMCAAAKAV